MKQKKEKKVEGKSKKDEGLKKEEKKSEKETKETKESIGLPLSIKLTQPYYKGLVYSSMKEIKFKVFNNSFSPSLTIEANLQKAGKSTYAKTPIVKETADVKKGYSKEISLPISKIEPGYYWLEIECSNSNEVVHKEVIPLSFLEKNPSEVWFDKIFF